MPSKCVETIDRLPYEGKDIVRSSGKPETRVHHRDRHWLGNPPEPAPGHRGRSHHNRCGHVRRSEGLTAAQPGIASRGTEAPGTIILEPLSLFGVACSG